MNTVWDIKMKERKLRMIISSKFYQVIIILTLKLIKINLLD